MDTPTDDRSLSPGSLANSFANLTETQRIAFANYLVVQQPKWVTSQFSKLLRLPAEVLIRIITLLPRTDQSNLLGTCHFFQKAVLPIFHEECRFALSASTPFTSKLEALLAQIGGKLRYARRVRVFSTFSAKGEEQARDFPEFDEDGSLELYGYRASIINSIAQTLLKRLPHKKLTSFEWLHYLTISARTLEMVIDKHQSQLTTLRVSRFHRLDWAEHSPSLIGLQDLACFTMDCYDEEIAHIVCKNLRSLRKLRLGQEWYAYTYYAHGRLDLADDQRTILKNIFERVRDMFKSRSDDDSHSLQLDTLELININVALCVDNETTSSPPSTQSADTAVSSTSKSADGKGKAIAPKFQSESNINKSIWTTARSTWIGLKRLALESCTNSSETLRELTNLFLDLNGVVGLQEFAFRAEASHEMPSHETLMGFLVSFRGLRLLSVLLDGHEVGTQFELSEGLFDQHGDTLEVFVWERRKGPRYSPDNSNTLTYPQSDDWDDSPFAKVCAACPKLVELSMVGDHYADIVGFGGFVDSAGRALSKLPALKTLHIRNAIESDVVIDLWESADFDCQKDAFWQMHKRQEQLAHDIAQSVVKQNLKSNLELVIIGPHRFREHHHVNCDGIDTIDTPDSVELFERVTCFDIAHVWHPKTQRRTAIVEHINQGRPVDDLQGSYHVRCLESYWIQ